MNAKYTVLLKTIMEHPETKDKLEKAMSTYPIYVPTKDIPDLIPTREELNLKILNHYKYREIGFETVGRFLEELEISLCEIMPYYNQRLHTVEIMNDIPSPFDNVDVVETFEQTTENTTVGSDKTKATSTGTADNVTTATDKTTTKNTMSDNGKNIKSQTPQSELSVPASNIEGVSYADEANWNKNESESNGETNGTNSATSQSSSNGTTETETDNNVTANGTQRHTFTKKGNQGVNTYAHDMLEFRETILNIVQEIIGDKRIKELFMLVY